jgi:transposase, IS5 family
LVQNQVQRKMPKALKNRASKLRYISTSQPPLEGFESPFSKHLSPGNRWVLWAKKIPWDTLVSVYQKQMGNNRTGADGINPRVVIGSLIIKHICSLSDRDTVQMIQENMYMQYFLGYSSFSNEAPFDPSLFVEFRNRLGAEQVNTISEKILGLNTGDEKPAAPEPVLAKEENARPPEVAIEGDAPVRPENLAEAPVGGAEKPEGENQQPENDQSEARGKPEQPKAPTIPNKGKMIVDATACPQDIRYPTDLNLLNDARKKSEELVDVLYDPGLHGKVKPRTYRKEARKLFLKTAQKKTKGKREIRKANKKQLGYLKRNIGHINKLLDAYADMPLDRHQLKYFFVIQTLYEQQHAMYKDNVHRADHRIVSIHQPHVRPIVRGKTNANVEFGAKIQVCLMNGFSFLSDLSWEAFNEGTRLMTAVEQFRKRFGCLPAEVLADQIYCTRDNRAKLKELGIRLKAKPLGRPPAVKTEHVRPGERNPIEGKFGQAKTAYGLGRIKARQQGTSESWIATIILVLNLVKLAGQVPYCLLLKLLTRSARILKTLKQLSLHHEPKLAPANPVFFHS